MLSDPDMAGIEFWKWKSSRNQQFIEHNLVAVGENPKY
jgi:hypothetical protein